MNTVYLVIIAILIFYIIYLHIQMVKKNVFIETTVNRLTGIEKDWKMKDLLSFLEEIKKLNYYHSFFSDKLFQEETLSYIFEDVNITKIYIHYTKEETDAKSIIANGFRFADSFYKTALPVSNDKLDFIIKHNSRKYFGDWLILICISGKIIESYSLKMKEAGINNYFVENIITETPPEKNDNSDLVYVLPRQYVKGYINHRTGEIFRNPDFNPAYTSPAFLSNIEKHKNVNS
jgi:hypothetical protein